MSVFNWTGFETQRTELCKLAHQVVNAEKRLQSQGINEGDLAETFARAIALGEIKTQSKDFEEYSQGNLEIRRLVNNLVFNHKLAIGMIELEYMPILNPKSTNFYQNKMENERKYNQRIRKYHY